ncbi:25680_t:CDS:2 [Gigaspora rosea]|nr:25680_t:CDS:2 [Gigaspora rosea]
MDDPMDIRLFLSCGYFSVVKSKVRNFNKAFFDKSDVIFTVIIKN